MATSAIQRSFLAGTGSASLPSEKAPSKAPASSLETRRTMASIFAQNLSILFDVSAPLEEERVQPLHPPLITSQPTGYPFQESEEQFFKEQLEQLKYKIEAYSLLPIDAEILTKIDQTLREFEVSELEKAMTSLSIRESKDIRPREIYIKFLAVISANIECIRKFLAYTQQPLHLSQKTAMIAHAIASQEVTLSIPIREGHFGSITQIQHKDNTSYATKKTFQQPKDYDIEKIISYLLPPHESVVEFLGINAENFLLMEYVPAGDLLDVIESKTLSDRDISIIAERLAKGIAFLHERGIIHADLKPENILFREGNVVKIADFGLSRFDFKDGDQSFVGSTDYAAPEMLLSEKKDAKIDVWSYSCILFALMHPSPFYSMLLYQLKYPSKIYNEYDRNTLSKLFRATNERTLCQAIDHLICSLKLSEVLKVCFIVNPEARSNIDAVLRVFSRIEKSETV